ncbi:hypothetical protein CWI38_0766p0050 [Hamiltosporidium tvaerminnensis]|uniref:Uncharacterized protein n=2 Tax=Hamiltosporidium TaxID=1176354 RepID=A0A4Q9KVR6_9MICR|nr:hypothetical protein CWI39_2327p0010 [Hamiltosporidium magnivora]TBU08352.1 hypothetical protein CWI36_0150p0010 [Hamiltosporidium magnivora]TBU12414.1 hypothetical protein CWI38_0766p0050 [Hamiltosporidium tvaerminnensis]
MKKRFIKQKVLQTKEQTKLKKYLESEKKEDSILEEEWKDIKDNNYSSSPFKSELFQSFSKK